MKKNLLVTIGLLFLFNLGLIAASRYWVGGTGAWNDKAHWAATSGGAGGVSVPVLSDDVFFDANSFSQAGQTVMLTVDGSCRNINWSGIDENAIFSAASNRSLNVYGSYSLSPRLKSGFKGKTIFKATTSNNNITSNNLALLGEWIFDGSGSWSLSDDINGSELTIKHLKGTLNTNDRRILCLNFYGNSSLTRTLNLGQSEIIVKGIWDFSSATNINFNSASSRIIFETSVDNTNFRSGSLGYGSVSALAAACSPSGQPCAGFTITLSATHVRCNGLSNGNVVATVVGGSGNFTYNWNGPATPAGEGTDSIFNLGAGNVTVRIDDLTNGTFCFCNINVLEPGLLFDYELYNIPPTCNGFTNGGFAVDATGGTFPYTYSWSGGLGTNDTVTNVGAGSYTATVTDVNGCTASTVVVLNEPSPLIVPGTASMVTCFGFCNGTASVNASGGTPPYSYDWSPGTPVGDTTANASSLCPGNYTVNVTDNNGCITPFDTTITEPPVLTLVLSRTNPTCGGVCDGTITATISGGTSQYTYAWSNGSNVTTSLLSNSITGLCFGNYSVTVTDANGCTLSDSVILVEPAILVATATSVNTSCFEICDGTASAVVTGGTTPPAYNFDWTGTPLGDGTANISGLCPGSYTLTVTDVNGCNDTAAVTITEPSLLVPNPTSTDVLCFGDCNGTASAAPTGGTLPYTYSWLPGNYTGEPGAVISNLCAGTYSVLVTDANGCDTIQSVTITQPTQIAITIVRTNVNCNGACDGTATANPTGGTAPYTFSWNPGGATTQTVTGLCPGTYTVTVTDANGCTRTQTTTITQPNVLNASLTATTLLCNGDCNATITSTVSGGTPGYTFSWAPGGETTPSITNKCAGSYTLTVTDAEGCIRTATITINQPTPLNVITSSTNVSCFGLCNGSASAIAGGGTPGYTYSWSPGGQTTSTITGKCAGTYTVTVTDLNGCTSTGTVTITEPTQIFGNPTTTSNINCNGGPCTGAATSSATGGSGVYSYNWLPGNPPGDGTPSVSGLCVGTYTLIVTDNNGCTSNQQTVVTQPPPLTATITGSTSSCNVCNGTATVSPAGGTPPYNISWSDPSVQTTLTATGLCPNVTYIVTVTDANGCVATGAVTIAQTITITITTSNTTLSCFGGCDGIATANAAGGQVPYSFLWVNSGGTVGTTQTVSNLCAGTYSVTVVDFNGCLNTDTVTFTNPPALNIPVSFTNASCGGTCDGTATVTPSGGTGAYSYLWSSTPVQTTQTATGLCAGTYSITVTDDNNCTATDSVTITEQSIVLDNPTITQANCLQADGTISVAPTGGSGTYTYAWTPAGVIGQGTPNITGLLPGAYDLTITSGAGCTYSFSYLVSNVNGPTLTMAHTNASCDNVCDGTATVTASGGAGGFVYNWAPGAPVGDATPSITALCGTLTYTVSVTDAAGCVNLDTATVINPDPISPNPVVVNESCPGTCDGSITLNTTGGTGAYTYSWSPGGMTTSSVTGLCAGSYTVIVSDANSCDSILVINITSPPVLSVTLAATNALCNSTCTGTATATPAGGSGSGYTYQWPNLPPSNILANVVNLCVGEQIVIVTDDNNCSATDTIQITEPPLLTLTTSQVNASCNGTCNGIAIVTPVGGTPGYSFDWSLASLPDNDTASSLCNGTYNVIVTDANGCIAAPPAFNITEPGAIVPNVTSVNPLCAGSCNGTATSAPTGGTSPYSFAWAPGTPTGDGTSSVSGLCAGSYTVTVTDSLGCNGSQNITLLNPPALIANPTSTSPSCANGCNGTATANPVGGNPGYSYSWLPGGSTSQTITNLCPNVYTVFVTDLNNCVDTQTVVVTNPTGIDVAVSSTPAACGSCDGTISINPTNGTPAFTYVWSPAPTVGQGTPNATSVCAGLYNVTVTDNNGCDSTFAIALNNAGGATGETVTANDATCNGVCDGSASIVPIGGTPPFTYLWTPTATANDTALNLCAGNYFVEITDSNSCVHFSPVTINQPAPIILNASVTSAICSNVCTGVISLATTGGTGAYSYNWSPGNPAGQGTSSITGLCPGSYTVTVTDANFCVRVDSFIVSQSTPLIATISSSNISCSSACTGVASINITSGSSPFNIQWNDPAGQTNDTATALCAGSYTVTIIDSLGCLLTLDTTITSSPPVLANASIIDASCGMCDGSATLSPSGGTAPYNILWSNGDSGTSSANLCSGLYTVNITDNAGCTSNVSIPVSNTNGPASVSITSTNITCNGTCNGAVTAVTPSGGIPPYSYLWINGGQTTQTISGLCAGTYYVEVKDSNGCVLIDSVTITEPSAIVGNQVITASSCGVADGAITTAPTGGQAPYTFLWSSGETSSGISNKPSGVYSVQITDNAGCVVLITIPLNSQNGPTLTMSSTGVTCNLLCNATATVTATGGALPLTYQWNDAAAQVTPTASTLCAGTYAVEVSGSDGCSTIGMITITEPDALSFSIANSVDPLCNGDLTGSITVVPSGGTLPYSYNWSTGTSTADTLFNVGANSYTVTVTDANGCTATQTVVLTEPPALTISNVSTSPSCNTINDGAIDVTVGGGVQPYNYQWSGMSNSTSEDLLTALSGSYTITVTDNNGCQTVDSIQLIPVVSVIASAGNDTIFCDLGAATLSAAGSINGVNYSWFDLAGTPVGTGVTITVTPPSGITTYYVQVDNGAGCPDSDTITVTSSPLPVANAGNDSLICQSGAITLDASASTGAASFEWFDMSNTSLGTGVSVSVTPPAGISSYYLVADNGVGCVDNDTITLTLNPLPQASAGNDTTFCDGGSSVTLDASASVNALTYQWFQVGSSTVIGSSASVTFIPVSGSTSYYVLVDNGAGCTDTDTVTISSNAIPTANAGSDATIIIGTSTVIGGNPTGSAGTTVVWNPLPGLDNATSSNPVATPTATTTYTVTVTSAQGCTATDSVVITVLPTIFIPDGISPNADGDNDEWMIDGIELFPNCVVEVYNRWGELLFQSVGYKERWKGTFKGKELPVGTYYYVIDLKDPLFPDVYTGPITILR